MNFVLESKTNKDKSKDIFPPLLLQPPCICACAMPRARSAKGSNFKEQGFAPLEVITLRVKLGSICQIFVVIVRQCFC